MLDIRQMFSHVAQVWVIIDIHGKVLLTSQHLEKFQHMLPVPVREGADILHSIPPGWQGIAANMMNSLDTAHPSSLETKYANENGKETCFEIQCTKISDGERAESYIFIEARDVTLQKIFERKITMVAREYEMMVENANAVIIGMDSRGFTTDWNEMACQVLGYSRNDSFLKKLSDFLTSESQETYARLMDNLMAGNTATNCELVVRAKNGKHLTILFNGTPKTNASDGVVGSLLIGQDITELSLYRRSLEEQVNRHTLALKSALENEKKLVEVKDRFVSMASHEFRSPIGYIHRNIEMIRSQLKTLSGEELAIRLSKIQSQAEHLSSLLEDVLAIGKANAPDTRMEANLKTVDLQGFLLDIIDEVQTNFQHSHTISLDFPPTPICVQSDEKLLRNIFVNLLTNAIKFSPGRDRVAVCVYLCIGYIEVEVKDWGLGINARDLSKVFDAFHRGENVHSIKGTGLGLSIVKKAVETLGGTIQVKSTEGTGTQFTVKLNINNS